LACLNGKRFVAGSETDADATLRIELIKRVTGDAKLTARFMYGNPFDFPRTFKLVLVTNHLPRIRPSEQNEATWRRVRVIPWNIVIPAAERDPMLLEKLRKEWPGILAWLIRGCRQWQKIGLGTCEAVEKATAAYREEEDIVGQFFMEECVEGPDKAVSSTKLYKGYCKFCEAESKEPISQTAFAVPLKQRGYRSRRDSANRCKWWKGIGLKSEEIEEDEILEES
jgi:putative DNA primase/helicase